MWPFAGRLRRDMVISTQGTDAHAPSPPTTIQSTPKPYTPPPAHPPPTQPPTNPSTLAPFPPPPPPSPERAGRRLRLLSCGVSGRSPLDHSAREEGVYLTGVDPPGVYDLGEGQKRKKDGGSRGIKPSCAFSSAAFISISLSVTLSFLLFPPFSFLSLFFSISISSYL